MGQPTFSRPLSMSNYQTQSHALPLPQQQPPSLGASQTHYNQLSARPKEYPYNSDYYERQHRSDPCRNYTDDSDTSDASSYRQTRNKRRSEPACYRTRDNSRQDFSPVRSVRNSPAHSRHSPKRSLTARESQSESETDSRNSKSRKKKEKIEKRQFLSSIPRYSGKGKWKAFYTKFSGYAKIAEWTDDQKMEQLCWC
ncbi:unnamed protein product [Mytilus coruscus]|uniref:Uncharacterized protein n=1 Tax=Mytilus coruscus TaxID=42192 RepID=A0A6J8B2K7_MYTCO|nr:unnamed protein product [Mytilus coruscus]